MRLPPLVALVVLLSVLGPPVVAAGDPLSDVDTPASGPVFAQQSADANRTTPWAITLPPSEDRRSGAAESEMDVAAAVADHRIEAVGRLEATELTQRLERAESDDRRFELLQQEARVIEGEIEALREAERSAVSAYVSEDISAAELVDSLARIDARAAALETRIAALRSGGEAIRSSQIVGRADELETRTATFEGAVVEGVRQAQTGEGPTPRIVVEATQETAVLTTVAEGTYYRQAIVVAERSSQEPTISLREAVDVFSQIYPAAFTNVDDIEAGGQRSAGVYYITIATRSGGQLTAYLDNRNQTVFRETYRIPVDRLPSNGTEMPNNTTATVEGTSDGLELTLQRTYPGGPVLVAFEDAETGNPVAATVHVRNTTVGRVGDDGTAWVPGSEWDATYTARTYLNESVTVTVPAP